MVTYDPEVIVTFADRLYAQARSTVITWGLLGFLLGGMAGAGIAAAMSSSRRTPVPGYIVRQHGLASGDDDFGASTGTVLGIGSVVLGTLIGVGIGRSRAFALRLQAQVALCQVQIEANTRSMVSAVGRVA